MTLRLSNRKLKNDITAGMISDVEEQLRKKYANLNAHPISKLFPMINDQALRKRVKDIRQNGTNQKVVLFENKILIGRDHFEACMQACVDPIFEIYSGCSPVKYYLSYHLQNHVCSSSARSWAAAKFALDFEVLDVYSLSSAAKLFGVSKRSVASAAAVYKHGVAELKEAVELNKIAISNASRICRLSPEVQQRVVTLEKKSMIKEINEITNSTPAGSKNILLTLNFNELEFSQIKRAALRNGECFSTDFLKVIILQQTDILKLPPSKAQMNAWNKKCIKAGKADRNWDNIEDNSVIKKGQKLSLYEKHNELMEDAKNEPYPRFN